MLSLMTNTAAPGWYADPTNPAIEHWWDGTAYHGTRATAAPVSAPPVGLVPAYGGAISPKSRTVASILGFFLGGLGVDRFYLGNIGMGVAKLLLGWLTLGIWPLVDWIVILAGAAHDGEGLPVTNWG
jgi:TM2 domain/Protein of unknown function (DUF2510)